MGIRETINQKPAVAAAGGFAVLAAAIAIVIYTNKPLPDRVSQAYYSDDDGKTYFADDVDKLYPFDHNGKQAYRAYVYQCPSGKPFVHYLARYTDATKAKLAALLAKGKDPEAQGELAQLRSSGIEVKKPGNVDWVSQFTPDGGAITNRPDCPDGGIARNISP